MKTLRDARIGETVKIARLNGAGALKRRLMDMGLTGGTEVEITVRGYELSLRKEDAEGVELKETGEA